MSRKAAFARFRGLAALVLFSVASGFCQAQNWDETVDGGGDAPPLPLGQLTLGTGTLANILGMIEQGENSADMYCISIPDATAFSASYMTFADAESGQLWLFDTAGNGIVHGCDTTSPYNVVIGPGFVSTTGNHLIAFTRAGVFPVDGGGNPIFPTITSGQTGPNAGVGPIAGWAGIAVDPPGDYRILFEGASYHLEDDPGGDGTQPDGGPWWTYTLPEHFNYGNLFNLEITQDATGEDCLRLVDDPVAWPFIAVANSSRGTLMRIAVQDLPSFGIAEGDVVGEYYTSPDGMQRNPSRTTVDGYGNAWVGNRNETAPVAGENKGSVTRVGLVFGGTRVDSTGNPDATGDYLQGPFEYCGCEDRDGDGLIKTSLGYPRTSGLPSADYANTLLAWPNTAGADTNGGVSTAEDECITAYYRTEGWGVRHVTVDANNDIWFSGTSNREFELVDGSLVSQVSSFLSTCGGYGGLIDPDGIVWSANWGQNNLMRYDPVSTSLQCLSIPNYGLGAECDPATGTFSVWSSVATDNLAREISPAGVLLNSYTHGSSSLPRGLVVRDGSVWVAHSTGSTVGRVMTDGTFLGNVNMFEPSFAVNGSRPHGVAADTNGKIWAVNQGTNNAMRIDPSIGVAGQVDLAVDLGSGAAPYNYSDMTGDLYLSISPQGTWTFVHDGGAPGCEWGNISWLEQIFGDASITVRVRASDSPVPSGPWTDISNGVDFTLTGQYMQVQVTITRDLVDCVPQGDALLCELMICKSADCTVEVDEVVCDLANPGSLNITGTVTNNSGVDATNILITPLPIGGGVTFTPNMIPVNIPDGSSGSFSTTVTGWTDGEEFCFLVTLLDDTMEVCCTSEVCITPDCDCLQVRSETVSVTCDPFTGDYTVTFTIDNLSGATIYHTYLFPPSGVTMTPNYFPFAGGIPDNTSTPPLTVLIKGAPAGEFCFGVTLHDELIIECCAREVCIDLPPCLNDPGDTDPAGTGALRLAGPPWVHLDPGLTAACGPVADTVLTIINNGDQTEAFEWRVGVGDSLGCTHALPDGAISPAAGTTQPLEPGKCVDIPLTIDVGGVPDEAIACLSAVIVGVDTGFATSAGGQVLGAQVLDDELPGVRLETCPADAGQVIGLDVGAPRDLSFFVTGDRAGAEIEYSVLSSNPFLSLNGGAPGAPVEGVAMLEGGAPTEIVVTAELVGDPGTWILDVGLYARLVASYRPTGPQALASVSVRDAAIERCAGDFNGDGVVDLRDVNDFVTAFVGGDLSADLDGNGVLDLSDVNLFVDRFLAGCGV